MRLHIAVSFMIRSISNNTRTLWDMIDMKLVVGQPDLSDAMRVGNQYYRYGSIVYLSMQKHGTTINFSFNKMVNSIKQKTN